MHHRESIIQEDIESGSTRLESKAIGVSSVSVCVCVFFGGCAPSRGLSVCFEEEEEEEERIVERERIIRAFF